jgi:hypothetical protein
MGSCELLKRKICINEKYLKQLIHPVYIQYFGILRYSAFRQLHKEIKRNRIKLSKNLEIRVVS